MNIHICMYVCMCVIVNMHSHTLTRWIYEIKACNLIQQMQNITLKMKMKNRARETHTHTRVQ